MNSAFIGFSQIDLQATRNISLTTGTIWDLVASTGISAPGSLLKLEAGNNITLANNSRIVAGEGWSVTLQAGRNFTTSDTVNAGVGTISFSGTASLETQEGNINLLAGNNISVGSGFVRTMNNGSITAHAMAGNINTGTRANGFLFDAGGYSVDENLGGISTYNGGDISLTAGQDIISFLPPPDGVAINGNTGVQADGGSGAFGNAPGNVTITAGRDVSGHFVVRNGVGTITAGRNAGTITRSLALSLISGGWNVNAGQDILLQEVRNPNGIFNTSSGPVGHQFDYAADAYTILNAGYSVQLLGTPLPRFSEDFSAGITPIYPGRLDVFAGAGGVKLTENVTLFPSPLGNLRVTTTDGGSLFGSKGNDLVQFVVSDSGKTQYRVKGDFGLDDHATVPIHLADLEPVRLDIAGDLSGILLGVAKRAEIEIGGDLINSRFNGQNLNANDTTTLHVAGDILNRNEFTTVSTDATPDFAVFELIYPPLSGSLAGLQNFFSYNATTHELTFQGRMTGDQLSALLNLQVRTLDQNGFPILDATGEPVTAPAQFVSAATLGQLYTLSQDVPQNPNTGYVLGGGGLFDITAHNLDLGATVGIVSQGPRGNYALANYFSSGADIHVTLTGNLDMFSTKIASLNGGEIFVYADGAISAGSRTFTTSDSSARGIFTVDQSDVTVIARGDINVNGSRIAAYDGGNVLVRSLQGDIDAGTGGGGAATVEKIYVNPVTHQILTYAPTIPGSGILATTFPPSLDPAFPRSQNTVGNILVETPRGDIIASSGGIVQIPLNGVGDQLGTVTLRAGTRDANGNVVYVGNIDASGSGVIGSTVDLEASGDIKGLVFARDNLSISAEQNVNVTALAVGNANVSAGDAVSGTIIGVGSVTASGASVDASLLSQNISASGDLSSSQVGFGQANAAGATSQSLQSEDQSKTVASDKTDANEDETKKRSTPRLAKTVGRVTVILPSKLN